MYHKRVIWGVLMVLCMVIGSVYGQTEDEKKFVEEFAKVDVMELTSWKRVSEQFKNLVVSRFFLGEYSNKRYKEGYSYYGFLLDSPNENGIVVRSMKLKNETILIFITKDYNKTSDIILDAILVPLKHQHYRIEPVIGEYSMSETIFGIDTADSLDKFQRTLKVKCEFVFEVDIKAEKLNVLDNKNKIYYMPGYEDY